MHTFINNCRANNNSQITYFSDSHIGNSREPSFEHTILKQTNGKGVDIVLNSLTEDKLQASVRCLSQGGTFLEIGRNDLSNENPLHLELFKRNCSFHGIQLDNFLEKSDTHKHVISDLLRTGICDGSIKPLTRTCFGKDNAEAAFRYMAAAKHTGKVLIDVKDENVEEKKIKGIPR